MDSQAVLKQGTVWREVLTSNRGPRRWSEPVACPPVGACLVAFQRSPPIGTDFGVSDSREYTRDCDSTDHNACHL